MLQNRLDIGWLKERPYAHRGLHDADSGIPENSLSAIQLAINHGYGIEVDIQPAADRTPMVFHDETLNRMTGQPGQIARLSTQDLGQFGLRGSGEPIPTLAEALALVDGRAPILIEIKHHGHTDGQFETAILKTLNAYVGPFALMSFEPSSLTALKQQAPHVPRGLVSEAYWLKPFWPHVSAAERLRRRLMLHAIRTAPHFIAYHWRDLGNPFLRLARRLSNKPLLTWTVRKPEEASLARERDADQIIFENYRP
jgi:glycerophosphoryl diester phosphodiesterase